MVAGTVAVGMATAGIVGAEQTAVAEEYSIVAAGVAYCSNLDLAVEDSGIGCQSPAGNADLHHICHSSEVVVVEVEASKPQYLEFLIVSELHSFSAEYLRHHHYYRS